MKSSVYISAEKIEVIGYAKAGGAIAVKDYCSCPLPEGTVINGKIIDSVTLVECLADLRAQKPGLFHRPALIVDGSSILSKRMVVPRLSGRQYRQLIRDDFADSAENQEDLICDYHLLPGSAGGAATAILACAAERSQVDDYVLAFKEAGIKLAAIRVGAQAILNYVRAHQELQKSTFVLNIVDGVTMLSLILENGNNVFMSRTRLYGEDHEQRVRQILDNLSGLIQFNRSQKFNDIAHSYYLGLGEDDLRLMDDLNPSPDISLSALDIFNGAEGRDKLPPETHLPYLNALLGKNSIDLIRSRQMLDKQKKQQQPKKYWLWALVGLFFLLSIPAIYLYGRTVELDTAISEVNDYINAPAASARSAEIALLQEETAFYNDIANQLKEKTAVDNNKASLSRQALNLITETAADKITVVQFDFDEITGLLRVNAETAAETDAAAYVNALKANRLVKDVKYMGYSYNNDGAYNFSIDIALGGKEAGQ